MEFGYEIKHLSRWSVMGVLHPCSHCLHRHVKNAQIANLTINIIVKQANCLGNLLHDINFMQFNV